MEPLQMKKRKKGGGYNLRKSLAWDRAFFTEEGVLDPDELSMISGSFGNSCGDLSTVSEDANWSPDSADLQSIEKTTPKEFPSPSSVGDKRKGSCFHMKTNSSVCDSRSPASVRAKKIPSTSCIKTETKYGGCPRPLASSSSKRPTNVNTARAAGKKDPKPPKAPISKLSPTRTKSAVLSESYLKHNQITQPGVNFHKNVGLKSSSKNVKGDQSKEKPRPNSLPCPNKIPSQHSGRSLANSLLEIQPSIAPLQPTVNPTANCSEHRDTNAISCPQLTTPNALKAQIRYNQTVKPSGLRMPSPSLGFFGQPKTLGSHGSLQKNMQPLNILKPITYGLQKFSALRPTSTKPAPDLVSRKIMKLGVEVDDAQKLETLIPNEGENFQPIIRSEHEVDDISDTKHNKLEEILCIHEAKSHMNDSHVLLQSGSRKQLKENEFCYSSGKNNTSLSNSDLGDFGNYDQQMHCIKNLDHLSTKQAELSVESHKNVHRDGRNAKEILECIVCELGSHEVLENEADPKLWAPNEIISVKRCERNSRNSANKQDLKVGDISEQSEEHLELKSFPLEVEQHSQCNLELQLDNDFSSFCKESLVDEVIESVESSFLERSDVNRIESCSFKASTACVPDQVEITKRTSIANSEDFNANEKFIIEMISSELNASLSKDLVRSVGSVQATEVNEPNNDVNGEEAEPSISIYNSHQKTKSKESFSSPPQLQNEERVTDSLESSKSGTNKHKPVTIKPPLDAVPFSDEWLAAIEAAGEDILTMKGGAVQNSPPDKVQPEPSPWSPVKKKNNQIGPFDCTKHTNILHAD